MASELDPASLVKALRSREGLSQRELARRADTSQSVVARIELGTTSPTVATLNRLLKAADQELIVRLRSAPRTEELDADSIVRRLRTFFESGPTPGVVSGYVFGSTVNGTRHRQSDIDVGVLLDRSLYACRKSRGDLRIDLGARLVGALHTNDVDLVILNDVPPGFASKIVLDGRRLLCSDLDVEHAFVRDVQLRRADLAPFLRRTTAVKLAALQR